MAAIELASRMIGSIVAFTRGAGATLGSMISTSQISLAVNARRTQSRAPGAPTISILWSLWIRELHQQCVVVRGSINIRE